MNANIAQQSQNNNCPKCGSPQPHLHPAVQHEGEVHICLDPWHSQSLPGGFGKLAQDITDNRVGGPADRARGEAAPETPIAGPEASFARPADPSGRVDASEVPASDPEPPRPSGNIGCFPPVDGWDGKPVEAEQDNWHKKILPALPENIGHPPVTGDIGQEIFPGLNAMVAEAINLFQTAINMRTALMAGGKVRHVPMHIAGVEGVTKPHLSMVHDVKQINLIDGLMLALAKVEACKAFLLMYSHDIFAVDFADVIRTPGWTKVIHEASIRYRIDRDADKHMQYLVEHHSRLIAERANAEQKAKGGEATGA